MVRTINCLPYFRMIAFFIVSCLFTRPSLAVDIDAFLDLGKKIEPSIVSQNRQDLDLKGIKSNPPLQKSLSKKFAKLLRPFKEKENLPFSEQHEQQGLLKNHPLFSSLGSSLNSILENDLK